MSGFQVGVVVKSRDGYVRAWVRGSTWHHFEEHGEQIRAWRAGR